MPEFWPGLCAVDGERFALSIGRCAGEDRNSESSPSLALRTVAGHWVRHMQMPIEQPCELPTVCTRLMVSSLFICDSQLQFTYTIRQLMAVDHNSPGSSRD